MNLHEHLRQLPEIVGGQEHLGSARHVRPLLVVAILALMVLPIPAWLLDTFFTLNIAVCPDGDDGGGLHDPAAGLRSLPSVLLLTTLMRLSLNVASTRVVLLEGHTGPGAAGAVIEAFGHFLIGGNFAVGLIVFAILVVINFIVVTKGAERIAEVSARFTLDAMPGKQMAVDADLNAGLIDEKEAKRRRAEVGRSQLLRLHGRCLEVRARRCRGRYPDFADQHRGRLHHWRAATRSHGGRSRRQLHPAGHR